MPNLFTPLSWLYEAGTWMHRSFYWGLLGKGHRFANPVVSIGNITWGGTGKTPLVLWMAERLQKEGKKVAILMRGYGSDEVKLYQGRGLEVAASANRVEAGIQLSKKSSFDLFLLDDGFQHWPVYRDLDIVCINALKPFGNGEVIPCGSLREPKGALKRAGLAVLTHADKVSPEKLSALEKEIKRINPAIETAWASHEALGVWSGYGENEAIQALKDRPYFLASGIGNPEGFRKTVMKYLGKEPLKEFRFRDHHAFRKKDLESIVKQCEKEGAYCLVTEKDWVRSQDLLKQYASFKYLKIRLSFLKGEEKVYDRVVSLTRPKKRSILILSDGKAGHVKQSLALLDLIKEAGLASGKVEVVEEEIKQVRYKSSLHRHFFWLLTPLLNFFEQDREIFDFLNSFLLEPTGDALKAVKADWVISAGSSLLPIQHILKKRLSTKAMIIMKPTGPYASVPWDLVIQPSHDGPGNKKNVISTLLALGQLPADRLETQAQAFDEKLSLKGKKGISFFVGGSANGYRFSSEALLTALEHTKSFAHKKEMPFFVTTSRRTSPDINRLVKRFCEKDPLCKLLVIPAEKEVPNTVETMLGLSHTALVTEESISMVSEAIRSGRRVISLSVGNKPLTGKKRQFQVSLKNQGWIQIAHSQELFSTLESIQEKPTKSFMEEDQKIKERLLTLL